MQTRIKLGLIGAVHVNMPGDDRAEIREAVNAIGQYSAQFGFDVVTWDKPVLTEEEADQARRFMDDQEVDFTLILNASLPNGRAVLPLSKAKSRLGFWSIPEPTKDGVLLLNSFCGVNMVGSIISHYTSRSGVSGKWFYGKADSAMFKDRFLCTIRALQAVKAMSTIRIAQIGGLANGFENMYADERDLEKRFGSYLQTRHSVEEIVARAEKLDLAEVVHEMDKAKGEARATNVPDEHMQKSTRLFMAFRDFAKDNDYDALAISCWPRFQEVYGIAVCGTMSRLNEAGILAVCEADIFSTVCMAVSKAMTGEKPALNDLVSLDESDNSANIWHCGVAPACWADGAGVSWERHFNIGHYEGEKWVGSGVVANMRFRPGAVTVTSMGGRFDQLFLMTGDLMKEKKGYEGSSGWVENLKINGAPVGIPELVNTIAVHRVNHHYTSSYHDLTNEWNEFAAWTGIKVLDPVPYKPYLQVK